MRDEVADVLRQDDANYLSGTASTGSGCQQSSPSRQTIPDVTPSDAGSDPVAAADRHESSRGPTNVSNRA